MSHIDPALRNLHAEAAASPTGRLAAGYVVVDVLATSMADAKALETALVQVGFQPTGRIGALLSGFLPVPSISDAAGVPALRTMLASKATSGGASGAVVSPRVIHPTFVGAVEGEASKALGADQARTTYNVNGSGVTIGVLSDSYNALGTAAADVTSGDLPSGIVVLEDLAGNSDEGRAMMQLAYDVAPGSQFVFHTAFQGLAAYAQGVVDLYNAGANVIVDDVTNGTEPYFQDGLVTQAIDYVAAQGVPYFTAAGNEAAESYEGDYINSGTNLTIGGDNKGTLHDFDTSGGVDLFLNVTLQPGDKLGFNFGYDEPSAAASGDGGMIFVGAAGQAPTSDYDVYVLDSPSASVVQGNVLALSDFDNPVTGLPYENIFYENTTGSAQTVYIAFTKLSGADRRLKFSNGGGSGEALKAAEYVGASTALGHANAVGAFTLAAAPYNDTAAFNAFIAGNAATAGPAAVAESSSIGGGLIYLDVNGNRLATPVDRMKPDATSSDGDNNTFFGDDFEPDGNPNFFGTSAAAPNAAAVAALMIEAAGGPGSLTTIQVYDALKNTAIDLQPWTGTDPYNAGTTPGYDIRSGVGYLNAEAAVASVIANLSATLTGVRAYRMLALPTGGTYNQLLAPLWTQGFTGSDRPAPSAGCSAYSYNETAVSFEGGYACLTDQSASFARGSGAYVYVYADDDLDTPGVQGGFPKTLTVPDPGYTNAGAPFSAFPLTYTNNPTVPSYQEGWNLLGNPLTAGMDWDETVRGGGLTPTIYVLDPNYFGGDYRTWTANIGGDLPNGVVPAFQGFFAKAVAASPTLTAPVASVVTPGPGVYGKTAPTPLRFELSLNETPVSATFVAVSPEAALGEDVQDAIRLTPIAYPRTVLSTRTIGDSEAVPLALNALPSEATGEIEVPLAVAAEGHAAGALALSLAWAGDLPEGWRATLVDREAGTSTPLAEGGTYAFTLDVSEGKAGSSALGLDLAGFAPEASGAARTGGSADSGDRFVLRITPASVVSTDATPEAAFGVGAPAPNPARGTVRVPYRLSASGVATVTVVDALGREVATLASGAHSAGSHEATLNVSSLAPGVYVVRLSTPEAASMARFTVVR